MGRSDPSKQQTGPGPSVHPDARAGGGGPGYFRDANSILNDDRLFGTVRHAKSPASRLRFAQTAVMLASAGTVGVNQKKPPKTKPLTKSLAKQSGREVNLDVRLLVLADKINDKNVADSSAKTRVMRSSGLENIVGIQWATSNGKITKITKKLIIRGTYTIRISYGRKSRPTLLALYGRGTTKQDKNKGDITLGFHEGCHRQEYLDYFTNNKIPTFTAKVGMSEVDFEAEIEQFNLDFETFGQGILQLGPAVDEVGYKLSQCKAAGKC